MDLKERIKQFCDSIGLSIREFERVCGLARGNISNMTGALGSDKLAKIIDAYRELNLYWLVTGEGPMLRDGRPAQSPEPAPSTATDGGAMVDVLRDMLKEKDAEIKELNREIGKLSNEIEGLKRGDVLEENVICAAAG